MSLPNNPFYNPLFGNDASTLLDLFGMGSLFYTVLTGRWPYKSTPWRFAKLDDRLEWEEWVVYPNFKMGKFPPVEHLPAGDVILKCWRREFGTAKDALLALDTSFSTRQYFHESSWRTVGKHLGSLGEAGISDVSFTSSVCD